MRQAEAAQRDPDPEQVGDQVRPAGLRPARRASAARLSDQADRADDQGTRLHGVEPRLADRRRPSGRGLDVVLIPRPLLEAGRRSSGGRSSSLGVLAQLQGPDVGDDRPAVVGRDPRGVRVHRAVAVGDHVEEVAERAASRSSVARGTTAAARSRAGRSSPGRRPSSPWQGEQ